ncbi:MAG: FtsX-like permease family protein [Prevotella sp.]|nr:FtsX-like permease family protein [Prevotella sp.]MBR1414912.1 FtsX-like permease family protein [Prevotella sp.]
MQIINQMLYMARRFKTATMLNFTGLVVAFAACYLFLTQVTYNHSYNRGLKDYEKLYRVETPAMMDHSGWQSMVSRFLADQLDSLPQVESMALVQCWENSWRAKKGETEMTFAAVHVSDNTLTTMAPRLLDGQLGWKEGDEQGIIIPASIAKTYFGETQVAGRSICWARGDSVWVRGVFEDFPDNSLMKNCIYSSLGDENRGNYQNYNYNCYLRLRQPLDTAQIRQTIFEPLVEQVHQLYIEHGMEDQWDENDTRSGYGIRLVPVTETWFSGVDPEQDRGNRSVDLILQLSCLLVIIIAAINFLNFTLAESPMRIKSINTRRVLGSTVTSLRLGVVAETVLTSMLAFVVALGVSYLLSRWPLINELTVGSIALGNHGWLIAALAVAALLVGVVAGLYPAFYVTSFQPALVLKGSFGLTPKGRRLRTGLLCLQFVITSIMVVYIGILYLQSHYIFKSDYGYAKDEILYCHTWEILDKQEALRTELMQQGGVVDVAYSQFSLGSADRYMAWGRGDKEHTINFVVLPVDWNYLRTMGIKVVEGRDFTGHDSDCYIINEAARRQWDWVEMDKKLLDDDLPVIGVCQNVRYASTRVDNSNTPMAFIIYGETYLSQGWTNNLGVMNVRVAAGTDKLQMRQKIKDLCMKLGAQHEPEVRFLDQMLERTYQEEFRFIRQVLMFSLICLVITLIGVFCMTMFETEYRRKEIGIRKVMGSSTQEILLMFCRHYALLLALSFIIAAPVAWYIGHQWLLSFAERTPIFWWLFPLALLAVGTITLLTVIVQSWRTANENPVNSIKSE